MAADRQCPPSCEINGLDDPICWDGNRLLGRNELPTALWAAWDAWELSGDRPRLRRLLTEAWTGAEYPTREIDEDDWLDMFDEAGFVTDCRRLRRPRITHVLWRGCQPGFEFGMSWSDSREKAQWFADRHADVFKRQGIVVELEVPAAAVLARFRHGREEREWVLDPRIIRTLTPHFT